MRAGGCETRGDARRERVEHICAVLAVIDGRTMAEFTKRFRLPLPAVYSEAEKATQEKEHGRLVTASRQLHALVRCSRRLERQRTDTSRSS